MQTIIYLLASLVLCFISLGLIVKLLMIGLNILSLPTYLGLMYSEDVHRIKKLKINKPPKNGWVKLIMNLFASVITLVFIECSYQFFKYIQSEELFMDKLLAGEIISKPNSILILVSLTIIYLINYFSEENAEDSFTKIDKLDSKPFMKLIK